LQLYNNGDDQDANGGKGLKEGIPNKERDPKDDKLPSEHDELRESERERERKKEKEEEGGRGVREKKERRRRRLKTHSPPRPKQLPHGTHQ